MRKNIVKIEQIRMDFSVTPEVQRYVYMYLILGQRCYLIDGAGAVIRCFRERWKGCGKSLRESMSENSRKGD